jgi:HK97 family phage major capsid protein
MPPIPHATTQASLRERLRSLREEVREARQERAEAVRERDAAREAFAGAELDPAQITQSSEYQAAQAAVQRLGGIEDRLGDLTGAEAAILQMMGQDGGPPDPGGNDRGSLAEVARAWDGRRLLGQQGEDTPYQRALAAGTFSSTGQFGSVQLGQISDREQFMAALPAATPGPVSSGTLVDPDRRGVIQPLLRQLRLLDLIPMGTTDSNAIEYVQVTAGPGQAAETAELAVKPEAGLTTVDATAPVRTIAGWLKLSRQSMDDVAGLATLVNTLLPHDVRRRIENQILAGDGVGQNLRGLLNTTGLGAPTFVTGDNVADAILRAMTTVILSDAEPNFVALNPLSWQDLLLMRENADRSGAYLYGTPGSLQAPTIWGLAITPSVVIPQATPLVGDTMGATLLVREGVNVKVSDSDQDDFIRNRVTVLAEARVAFPVWRPASFAIADTTAP